MMKRKGFALLLSALLLIALFPGAALADTTYVFQNSNTPPDTKTVIVDDNRNVVSINGVQYAGEFFTFDHFCTIFERDGYALISETPTATDKKQTGILFDLMSYIPVDSGKITSTDASYYHSVVPGGSSKPGVLTFTFGPLGSMPEREIKINAWLPRRPSENLDDVQLKQNNLIDYFIPTGINSLQMNSEGEITTILPGGLTLQIDIEDLEMLRMAGITFASNINIIH